jgi:hypothetical protein
LGTNEETNARYAASLHVADALPEAKQQACPKAARSLIARSASRLIDCGVAVASAH